MHTWFNIDGSGPDEPAALWTRNLVRTQWLDHGALLAPHIAVNSIWANALGKELRLDINFEDTSALDSVARQKRRLRPRPAELISALAQGGRTIKKEKNEQQQQRKRGRTLPSTECQPLPPS